MPNIATLLKSEIERLSKKVYKSDTQAQKKASSKHRSDIAALKRSVLDIERRLTRLEKSAQNNKAPAREDDGAPLRFRATTLKIQRQRLGLSGPQAAKLLGVGLQSIYNWESGSARPRDEMIKKIVAMKSLKKRDVDTWLAN